MQGAFAVKVWRWMLLCFSNMHLVCLAIVSFIFPRASQKYVKTSPAQIWVGFPGLDNITTICNKTWGMRTNNATMWGNATIALENQSLKSDLKNPAEVIHLTTTLPIKWAWHSRFASCNLYFLGDNVICHLATDTRPAQGCCFLSACLLVDVIEVGSQLAVAGMLLLCRPLCKHKLPPSGPHSSPLPPPPPPPFSSAFP